mmetsp:Transcript_23877/g.57610  ORF Transcript_23877/g.57610 Transcript_23877/m.57610 type:complete len:368 (-) Transcript_23877:336-1439(-)
MATAGDLAEIPESSAAATPATSDSDRNDTSGNSEQRSGDSEQPKRKTSKKNAICRHGRQQNICHDCDGKSICIHKKRRTRCAECGGGNLCVHGRRHGRCKEPACVNWTKPLSRRKQHAGSPSDPSGFMVAPTVQLAIPLPPNYVHNMMVVFPSSIMTRGDIQQCAPHGSNANFIQPRQLSPSAMQPFNATPGLSSSTLPPSQRHGWHNQQDFGVHSGQAPMQHPLRQQLHQPLQQPFSQFQSQEPMPIYQAHPAHYNSVCDDCRSYSTVNEQMRFSHGLPIPMSVHDALQQHARPMEGRVSITNQTESLQVGDSSVSMFHPFQSFYDNPMSGGSTIGRATNSDSGARTTLIELIDADAFHRLGRRSF